MPPAQTDRDVLVRVGKGRSGESRRDAGLLGLANNHRKSGRGLWRHDGRYARMDNRRFLCGDFRQSVSQIFFVIH